MFTGLIEEVATVINLSRGTVGRVTIAAPKLAVGVAVGDSVAIDGACLTATSVAGPELTFDAVPETFSRTTLGDLKPGDSVNLESSLKAGEPIGGHFVQGHVDGVGTILTSRSLGESRVIRVNAPGDVLRYVVEKGSIAVDGISLTVASCDSTGFTTAVIPHTLEATTLNTKRAGDRVNLEADILGKYVEKMLGRLNASSVSEELLRDAGFMG
jgi:riboflavin synthase